MARVRPPMPPPMMAMLKACGCGEMLEVSFGTDAIVLCFFGTID